MNGRIYDSRWRNSVRPATLALGNIGIYLSYDASSNS